MSTIGGVRGPAEVPEPEGEAAARGAEGAGARAAPPDAAAAGGGRAAVLARLTAAPASGSAPAGSPAASPQALKGHVAGLPRRFDEEAEIAFDTIEIGLRGSFLNWETEEALDCLERLDAPQWLAVLDKLAATPGEGGKPLLEKFADRGLEDRNRFLERFVRQANEKLGLGLDGASGRELRREGRHVLAHWGAGPHTDLGGVLRTAAEGTVDGARNVLAFVLAPFFRPRFDK